MVNMKHMMFWVYGIFALCFLAVGMFYFVAQREKERQAVTFFSSAFKSQGVVTSATVRGKSYDISQGDVISSGKPVPAHEAYKALRIAYARELARQSPFLALPATNPDEVDMVTRELERVANKLADVQKTTPKKRDVRDALYPTAFLHAAASLERARQAFVGSGSDGDGERYQDAMGATIAAFKQDLARHRAAFLRNVPVNAAYYQVFGGTMTRESILASMDRLSRGIEHTEERVAARQRCLAGSVTSCDGADLVMQGIEVPAVNHRSIAAAHLHDILSLYTAATGKPYTDGPVYELSASACTANLDAPPLFSMIVRAKDDNTLGPEFVGDILFTPSATYDQTPFFRYYLDNNVQYVFFPVMEFYKCENMLDDFSRVFHMSFVQNAAATYRFSQYAPPSLSEKMRALESAIAPGPEKVIQESDTLEYVALSMRVVQEKPDVPPAARNILFDLALATQTKTAGFENFIRRVVQDQAQDVGLMRNKIPVEIGADYLFYVRSGLYSFLQGSSASLTGKQSVQSGDAAESKRWPFVTYTELQREVPRQQIEHDMKFFITTHRNANGAVTDIIP